ncbi:hypothetical protein XELAEV_18001755mg [Xenopus laevis]|uniref:Uncharacterized protein n=1 Tax=Xenopus laevis TaxID=8355 RepID=A0A974BNT0_XENLA|nr:hypothetical protein XELAEV_18001755mg [Xenopus laevis]
MKALFICNPFYSMLILKQEGSSSLPTRPHGDFFWEANLYEWARREGANRNSWSCRHSLLCTALHMVISTSKISTRV